jgi:hypothetical protein
MMVLKVQELPGQYPGTAVMVSQRYFAVTKGSAVGTNNLMNCLGIVMHNKIHNVGAVAHVEAREEEAYKVDVDLTVGMMIEEINRITETRGFLEVVLLGNAAGGESMASALESILMNKGGLRIHRLLILDLRNKTSYKAGRASSEVKGIFGGCVYEPGNEQVWLLPPGRSVTPTDKQPKDVKIFQCQ